MTKFIITVLTALTVSTVIFVYYFVWVINNAFVKALELGSGRL